MAKISFMSEELYDMWRACQCCLDSSGDLKSMLQEYTCNGIQEVYQDMLHECFSIQMPVPLSGTSDMLICAACIDNLRNVLVFRRKIEKSQRRLRNLEKLQQPVSVHSFVKNKYDSDEEVRDISDDCEDVSEKSYEEKKVLPVPEQVKTEDILQRALERTKKNLELLHNTFSEKKKEVVKFISCEASKDVEFFDSVPKDPVKRKNFLSRVKYARSIPYKLEKTDRTCKVCKETLPSHKALMEHMPTHYPNYICNDCGKLFILKTHLEKHVRNTHNAAKVACPVCSKSVKKDSLLRHVRAHEGEHYMYKCHYCPEKFTSFRPRMDHMSEKHGHRSNEYKCSACSKVFKASSNLKRHFKRVHLGEKTVQCTECDLQFFNKRSLDFHMLTHTKERNFECEVCHKKYPRKYTLTEHMKIHNNVRNHVCTICGRAFTQKCTLLTHVKTHDNFNSNVCDQQP